MVHLQVDNFQVMLDPQLSINEMFSAAPDYQGEEHEDGTEPEEPQEEKEEKEEERKRRGSGQEGEESSNGTMNIDEGVFTRACMYSTSFPLIHIHTYLHVHVCALSP